MRNGTVFKLALKKVPHEEVAPKMLRKMARIGHELGGVFPKLLLPLVKQLAHSIHLVLDFLDEAMTSPNWTQSSILNDLGYTIIRPVLNDIQFSDRPVVNRSANEMGTLDLKKLISHISPPKYQSISGLRDTLLQLLRMMADMETLNPYDFYGDLSSSCYRFYQTLHKRRWGDV